MKLATVNPELGFDIEQIISKQVNPPTWSLSPSRCYFRYALINVNCCSQMMLSQDRHLAFYGVDPGSSSLTAPFNQGIMQTEMMCNISNPVDVLHGTIHDVSTMNQVTPVYFMTCVFTYIIWLKTWWASVNVESRYLLCGKDFRICLRWTSTLVWQPTVAPTLVSIWSSLVSSLNNTNVRSNPYILQKCSFCDLQAPWRSNSELLYSSQTVMWITEAS